MRLFDAIVQSAACVPCSAEQALLDFGLPRAAVHANELERCPKRYVLDDNLTRICTALAFSEGDRLHSCLDLIRLPISPLWVEWPDAIHLEAVRLAGFAESHTGASPESLRAGVLIASGNTARCGEIRTFWSQRGAEWVPYVAPTLIMFDLDGDLEPAGPETEVFERGTFGVHASGFEALTPVFANLRLKLEPPWAAHYRSGAVDRGRRLHILESCGTAVASSVPMLLAFLLLLNSKSALQQRDSQLQRLNRSRARAGKRALLDHTEVAMAIDGTSHALSAVEPTARRGSRLHHVRGHLVRRGSAVFWRMPHLRGHVRFGAIRSQTVKFRFESN